MGAWKFPRAICYAKVKIPVSQVPENDPLTLGRKVK
jgi:hypothetical protein